jgi:uncharacterized OsmC-like protein
MTTQKLTEAIDRVQTVLRRRPDAGIHDDAPATAQWTSGARCVASHPNGMRMSTDMPTELGGTGDQVTPGWLFRAGLASCAATSIVMAAAAEGIALSALEVKADSRSDVRGLLGMPDADGRPVDAGPQNLTLSVRIAADHVDPERLRAIVQAGIRRSPVPNTVTTATPLDLHIAVGED